MIIMYLVSFSLLITSVIKVTGVFIHLDKKMVQKHEHFIKDTRSLHQNSKGNITLAAALFTLMISALFMFFTLKNKIGLKEIRYRKDSYLCFHYLNIETEKYIKAMSKFNITLRTLYAAQFTPATAAEAKAAFEATVLIRNARHIYYVKDLLKNNYCKDQSESLPWITHFPFEKTLAFTLVTNIDKTTKLKATKWKLTHYKNPAGIRLKKSFCLTAEMEAANAFFPAFKIKTAEVPMTGLSKLKCSSGFL